MKTQNPQSRSSHRLPRLAESAFELFAEHGFAKVNLDRIAAHAGVTKGSLYWHFESKKELILAACNYYYRRWHEAENALTAPLFDPAERLRRVLEFSVHSCITDRKNRLFTTGIFMLMQEDAEVRASWTQFYSSVREVYVGLVAAAQAAGQLPGFDARRAVDLMLEAMEGLKLRAAFEPQIAQPEEKAAILDGLWRILCGGACPATHPQTIPISMETKVKTCGRSRARKGEAS